MRPARQVRHDDVVKPFFPGDEDRVPEAVPAVPEPEAEPDVPSFTLDVDGEVFAIRPNNQGGTDYTWLSGPNPGYGFGESPARELSMDEHRQIVRDFLADIDPATGYLRDD